MGDSCLRNCCHLRRLIAAALYFHLCVLAILLTVFSPVEPTGSFEVRLHRFSSQLHRAHNPSGCCSGLATTSDSAARSNTSATTASCSCPVSFRVCVKNYQASVDSAPPCVIGEYVTPVFDVDRAVSPLQEEKPIVFYFNFTWPGSFSLVIEAFSVSEVTGERMLMSRFIAQRSVGTKLEWTRDVLISNRSSELELYYRVRCETSYFGERCATFCKPRDDKFGHYTCRASDGVKICNPGWEGDYCTDPVCHPGCHNGQCTAHHKCLCRHGWEGELCDICSTYPGCEHGTCNGPWQCNCNEGWGGLFCNQDLNYCTNHRPCKNNGVCTNTGQGSYTCTCTPEYMGKDCDVLRNPCQQNPCQNGGLCVNPSEGNYTCECRLGFYGLNCETSASICTENPCKNGGTCIDNPEGFSCTCTPSFHGLRCEKTIYGCEDDFCLNGGQCSVEPGGPHCLCMSGFIGKHCEELSSCLNEPCQNGGYCYELSNSSRCSCTPDFTGTLCEIKLDNCISNPCRNGGKCRHLVSGYECVCELGFTGKDCSEMNPCDSEPCLNGGLCKTERHGPNYFSCHCPTGFEGDICQFVSSTIKDSSTKKVLKIERTHRPTVSNISHHVMTEDRQPEEKSMSSHIAIILSCSVVVVAFVTSCAIVLVVRFCCARRGHREPKCCEEPPEDELKQNERNMLRMNNKCTAVPQKKIVNTLDRVPGKVTNNEASAKVLNVPVCSSKKRVLEKNLLYAQRTLDRRDRTGEREPSGLDNSTPHSSQDWSPRNSGGVFVIQDHMYPPQPMKIGDCYQARPPSLLLVEDENVFATEV